MDEQIIATYCVCEDLLIALGHHQDPQCQMSDAFVMTTAIVAALYFGGNYELARQLLAEQNYIPHMLSKSRFNRRLHRIRDLFLTLFEILGELFKDLNAESIYIIDTIPIPLCDNIRIKRSRIYKGEAYRGYQSSKKRYFYGVKIHFVVTAQGRPVEFFLTPGIVGDVEGLQWFDFDLPTGSEIFGDRAYNDYNIEDVLKEVSLYLVPIRKKNLLRQHQPWKNYIIEHYRKMVETAGSLVERKLPKSIHAVTPAGFELKVVLFVLATSINSCPITLL